MNLDLIRQKIESGAVGFAASFIGFASIFLALLPSFFQTTSNAPRWELAGAIWYCAMVGILCASCIIGTIFSLYALFVLPTRHAWLGLLFGFIGLLFVPTYLLQVFSWFRRI